MNNSLEALEKISWRCPNDPSFQEWCNTIKQDLERLEELETENQELKEYSYLLELSKQHEEFKNEKRKKAIKILKDYLNIEIDIDSRTIITDVGDTSIVGATKDDIEDLLLLKEVLK